MRHENSNRSATDRRSPAPERSLTQRLQALDRANAVRTRRAELKRDLRQGRCSIRSVLLDPPDYIQTAKVFDMLLAVPRYGRVKVNKVLTQCRIAPSKTIGGLSERQRDALVRLVHQGVASDLADVASKLASRRATPSALTSVPGLGGERSEPAGEQADESLLRALERILDEARLVGRVAGHSAGDAGEQLDASAPRPDGVGLRAALSRTLGQVAPPLNVRVVVTDDGVGTTTRVELLDAPLGETRQRPRAELRRNIAEGVTTVEEVILTCPSEAETMTIAQLLTSQRRWGTTRASKFLAGIGMPETKTLGSMTERQRSLLAALLS